MAAFKKSADLPFDKGAVVGLEDSYPAGYVDPPHTHDRCQLCFTRSGTLVFTTPHDSYILPPFRGLWLPSGMVHQVLARDQVVFQLLYIDANLRPWGDACRVFDTTPLMRALVAEILNFRVPYTPESREGRLTELLLDELGRMPDLTPTVRMPPDERLARICREILADPARARDLDEMAHDAAMGRRTFTRLFREQTGMSMAAWRQQARIMEAVAMLERGKSVAEVAYAVGYDSVSAFSTVFRRLIGAAPGAYVAERLKSGTSRGD